jgi:beta-lactamase regulating signal transducer with metallopeptidase domain
MTATMDFHPIAVLVAERMVACLVAGSVLTACAGLVLRLMNRQNARSKFALCFATLTGIAIVPLLGWWQVQSAASMQGAAPVLRLPEVWAVYLFAIWATGVSIALGRVALGLYRVRQVRRSCVAVSPAPIESGLLRTLADFQSHRSVELCTSESVRVPTAIGFWRPAIALPSWCMRDLAPAELHSIVLHELEHLRRYDDWTNLFQRVVGAIFFFHPAVWWLESRLSLEREIACDDAVLAVVPDPKSYARCLVSLAEKSYLRRGIALAQAAVSRVQQLTARVTQILDTRRSGSTMMWKPALSLVMVAAVTGGASLEITPRLVAFQSDARQSRAAQNQSDVAFAPSVTTASDNSLGRSTEPMQISELKPTPTRWVVPDPIATARPLARHRTSPPQAIAENSRGNSVLATQAADSALASKAAAFKPVLASKPELTVQAVAPAQMLVMVVHTEQRDESGVVLWSIGIVRWMVFHPQTQNRVVDTQIPTKT